MRASSTTVSSSGLLPTALTPLVGREADLEQLQHLIDAPSVKLMTLTGPAGVGKTRLAVHLATTLVTEFETDVVFVPLTGLRDPTLVLSTIAQALGLPPDGDEDPAQLVAAAMDARRVLLVLDNFEHLLDAVPSVEALLTRSRRATILVTSQAALGIPGEQLFPLLPLTTPALGVTAAAKILRADAVALFVRRAQSINPSLVIDDQTAMTIAEISRRLDGLPLAIELAAARVNILTPQTLLNRLGTRLQILGSDRRGVPDRLRTLRHAIAWSYDLLLPELQELFRALSVFAGGFTLDAVASLPQREHGPDDASARLGALVDHSLVQVLPQPSGQNRFIVLETLREYGLERLRELGEDHAARLAHATWFLHLAEAAEPHLVGSDQEAWLNRLGPEWGNIRDALTWSLEHGPHDLAPRLLGALWRFCSARGHTTETRQLLERALAQSVGEATPWRSRALIAAGNLALNQRDQDAAQALLREAHALAAAIGHTADEIQALIGLAKVAAHRSDYTTAIGLHQRAAALACEIDDQRSLGVALGGLAYVAYFQGDLDEAVRYWEEGRQVVAQIGDRLLESTAVSNLGAVAMMRGELDRAQGLLTRTLELQRRMQAHDSIPYTLTNLSETWRQLGDYARAEELIAEAVTRFHDLGYVGSEGTCLTSYAQLVLDQGDRTRAAMLLVDSTELIDRAGDPFPITENADMLAEIYIDTGNLAAAIELLAAAAAIRASIGAEPKPLQGAHLETLHQRIRQSVPEAEFARYWDIGSGYELATLVRKITIGARALAGAHQGPPASDPRPSSSVTHSLTAREVEVLGLLAHGNSTQQISDLLFISPRTTTTHVNHILEKLGVGNRAAAVAWALRHHVSPE